MAALRRALALAALVSSSAAADESTPAPKAAACEAAPPAVTQEIERLLKHAAEHASHSSVCMDGDGERTTIKLLGACVARPTGDLTALVVTARYRVTVTSERGGECTPYPDCARSPPLSGSTRTAELAFTSAPDGLRLVVPRALAGVALKTPLARVHSTGCHGNTAAFVPRAIRIR